MGPVLFTRRLLLALAAIALMVALGATSARAATPLSISISGNHFVNGAGQTVRLLGVNHPSFEYACADGFGYDDGNMDDADAAAIAAWGANAVRVPLNEDCWLGINNDPNNAEAPGQTFTAAGYQQAVEQYVADLHAHGLYAILDLHWNNGQKAQQPMPDATNSPMFWTSVATAFKSDPAVVFDLFNEPFDPTQIDSGVDPIYQVPWGCWENGGCNTVEYNENGRTGAVYAVAGMQTLLNAVRATGATQPVMAGGLNFANDLTQWAANEPVDPLHQLAASMHAYSGQNCSDVSPQANGLDACFGSVIAPIAANVPVVIGEFDQNPTAPLCTTPGDQSYDTNLMNWADQNGVSYLAWGWVVETQDELTSDGCNAYELISDANGTPFGPNGTIVHDHLTALASGATGTGTGTGTPIKPVTVKRGGSKPKPKLKSFAAVLARHHTLHLVVASSEKCRGAASIATAKKFGHGKHRARVSFGSGHFTLAAGRKKTVSVALTKAARAFLASHPSVKVRVTLTLVNAAGARTHASRTLSLH